MINMQRYYKKNNQILCREFSDGPVLIDPYRRTLVRLNPTALEIWHLLDGGHSTEEIAHALEDRFDADAEDLKKDIAGFIQELVRREMVI